MKLPALPKIKKILISFTHLQLFITLISIPILLSWGMPISLLTFAGNFFFSPLLTAFLLLSSLIFFCELMRIPNGILIWMLEHITHWWLLLMQWAGHSVLLPFALPSVLILILIFIVTLLILHHKKIKTPFIAIICYSILLAATCLYLTMPKYSNNKIINIDCNKGTVHILKFKKQLIVIDPGVIGRRLSASSWCEYTLMPALTKQCGCNTIDHLIILQPNRIIFEALLTLLEKISIKNIYIPLWQGHMPSFWARSFMKLKQACQKNNCALIRMANQPISIDAITIKALDEQICVNRLLPRPVRVDGAKRMETSPLRLRFSATPDTSAASSPAEACQVGRPGQVQAGSIEANGEKTRSQKADEFSYPAFKITAMIDNQSISFYSAKHKLLEKKDHNGTQNSDAHCA
jgi:beta-lactamase superfamily II metal-dependent hydrolase